MNVLIDPAARPIIAHRGNSAYAPENTFVSFDQALAFGVDAIEFDVRLTRDGHAVIIHDATVDRTTNGTGPVSEYTLEQLRALDAGARFRSARGGDTRFLGQGHVIPTLDELLPRYPSIPLLIEVKIPEAVEPTRRLLERHGAIERTLVDSTDPDAVEPFRGGALATGASFRDVVALLRQCWRRRLTTPLAYEALCIPRWYYRAPVPVTRLARLAATVGAVTHVWTVNSTRVASHLWAAGVNGIITDRPGAMRSARAALIG